MNPLRAPAGLSLLAGGLGLLVLGLPGVPARAEPAPTAPFPAYHAPAEPAELLRVDEPMRQFFAPRLQRHRDPAGRLRALLDAIFEADGLGFTYERAGTYDVRETFRRRRGNCVSFSFLVVAVARAYGFQASFQDVTTPAQWDRLDNLVISVRHMNVRVDLGREYYLIDLRPDILSGTGTANMRVISDARASAEFYGSAGFFELLNGFPDEATRSMDQATATDPGCSHAWSNRAALLAHFGRLPEARASFERALAADPRNLFALEGYVGILQRLGTPADLLIATRYERKAQSVRDRNPYYQQGLARRAREAGDWPEAEKYLRRALSLKHDEPSFHEEWIQVLRQLGRETDARRAEAKLAKLRRRLADDRARHAP